MAAGADGDQALGAVKLKLVRRLRAVRKRRPDAVDLLAAARRTVAVLVRVGAEKGCEHALKDAFECRRRQSLLHGGQGQYLLAAAAVAVAAKLLCPQTPCC